MANHITTSAVIFLQILEITSGFFKAAPCAESFLTSDCSSRGLINTYNLNIPPETTRLNLNDNEFTTLHGNEFLDAGISRLQKLTIQRNQIGKVDNLAFHGLKDLVYLDLSRNLIQKCDFLLHTPNLRTLNLSSNPIYNHQIISAKSLEILDLASCNLRYIPQMDLQSLMHLNLSNNPIHQISTHHVSFLPQLVTLQLIRAPISCDESTRQGFEILIDKGVDFTPTCFFTPRPFDIWETRTSSKPRLIQTAAVVPNMITRYTSSANDGSKEGCLKTLQRFQKEQRAFAIITLTVHFIILLVLLIAIGGFLCCRDKKKNKPRREMTVPSENGQSQNEIPPPPYRPSFAQGYLV